MLRRSIALLLSASLWTSASAEIGELTLNDLLAPAVAVASKKSLSSRETPSIVTVVTGEDIAASGARDLVDVLRSVPGFVVATDVQGVLSLGVRGMWAQEGKVLLMVDGQEMNEIFYSGLALGPHIPLEHVKQIEIIRGPGSALYGGTAELAVINVVTRSEPGLEASASYGRQESADGRRSLSGLAGVRRGEGTASLGLLASDGILSDRIYTDSAGTRYSLADASPRRALYANAAWQSPTWQARLLMDQFHTHQRDSFDRAMPVPVRTDFNNYFGDLRRVFRPAAGWSVTPHVKVRRQIPWKMTDPENYWYKTGDRLAGGLTATRDAGGAAALTLGGEYFEDRARVRKALPGHPEDNLFSDGQEKSSHYNAASFFEAVVRAPWAVFTAGGRFERNSRFGSVFVPRFGLTKAWKQLHLKALHSQAYRAPAIMNYDLNPDIKPERTRSAEFEAGWRWSDRAATTLNVFDIVMKDPIIYTVTNAGESYLTGGRTGSRGLEATHAVRAAGGSSASVSYSYQAPHDNRVASYAVAGRDGYLLGMPAHKAAGTFIWRAARSWTLSPSFEVLGRRHAFQYDPVLGAMTLQKLPVETQAHLAVTWLDPAPGVSLQMTVHNAFDAKVSLPQPYAAGHPPLFGPGREWGLRLNYRGPR